MKTQNLRSGNISSVLNGMNPPFVLETYVELDIFISGITGHELSDKKNTQEYILAKLSENLNVSHYQIIEFEATSNQEPYDMNMKLNLTLVKNDISRFQMGNIKDLEYDVLKILQANIINLI